MNLGDYEYTVNEGRSHYMYLPYLSTMVDKAAVGAVRDIVANEYPVIYTVYNGLRH